ncbi:MAG: hypothetical protein IJX88_04790 [Clostridia bacterium]|nr:hypothetical protein [Clostridia bacterium]
MRNTNASKRFLALLLSVMTMSSVGAFAACKDDSSDNSASSSSSSSSVSTVKDDGEIKNASFENDTFSDTTVIGTSVTGWSRSVNSASSGSALSSKSASGVIDISDSAWEELTKSKVENVDKLTEEQAKAKWSAMSIKDKLEYYEAWEDANDDDDKDVDDLSFYQSFNIDAEDLPAADMENPRTHDYKAGETNKNKRVLMLRNEYSNSTYDAIGTAQKYTSSSTVTVKAGTSAKFSVWVKTAELQSSRTDGTAQEAVGKGAYISITNTLGGATLDPLVVENINTEDMTNLGDTNGWAQYSFYLKGASYADTTFTIVLGLGQGGGTDRSQYVNGYAFFDDIEFTTLSNTNYMAETGKFAANELFTASLGIETDKKKVDVSKNDAYKAYAIDYFGSASTNDLNAISSTVEIAPTTETRNGTVYTAVNAGDHPLNKDDNAENDVTTYQGLGVSTTNDKNGVFTPDELAAMTDNAYVQAAYNTHLKDSAFVDNDEDLLLLLSANGAAYTAKAPTVYTLDKNQYMGISFFVKTSALNGNVGAGVTVVNGTNKTSIASIDTTTVETVEIEGETEDLYDGWLQCFFFISNETDKDGLTFTLEFTFGQTTVVDTAKTAYYPGFAMFKDFQEYQFADEKAFDCAGSGTYAKIVSLTDGTKETDGNAGFDEAAIVPTNALENGFANPKNYKGVTNKSAYVNNTNTDTALYTLETAGLLNKKYADNYGNILKKLGGSAATWANVFGNETQQPLVIYNESAPSTSYGFIGATQNIAASTYKTVALRVKTNSTVSVYLVDADDETKTSFLSVDAKATYWYDDDGNLCDKDPAANDFNSNRDVAFKLQSNGLYKVNTQWREYDEKTVDKNAYYANLSAYTADEDGNLVTAENGVKYDYTDNWRDFGNDGIAFYQKDGKYYADSAKKVEVLDFAKVASLDKRTTGFAAQEMKFTIEPTDGKWVTVTFHIHTGDTAKNYRLEVWNGDREGKTTVAAGSYAFFDVYNPGTVDDQFSTLITQRQEEIEADETLGAVYESVFSFYDTDRFLRYDASADKNNVGNSYESYLSSTYTQGVAFLRYVNKGEFEIYADYTHAETAVTADVEEEETEDEKDDTTTTDTTNVWLLASSIVIAAVLVLAVISLVVRKIVVKARKKRGAKAVVTIKKSDKKSK